MVGSNQSNTSQGQCKVDEDYTRTNIRSHMFCNISDHNFFLHFQRECHNYIWLNLEKTKNIYSMWP